MTARYTQSPDRPAARPPEAVSELVGRMASVLEGEFRSLFVEGEVSNFKRHASGHCYFTIKDASAQLRCVMWKSNAEMLRFRPADGMAVRIRGGLAVYPARGEVQLNVRAMQPAGLGDLQRAFAELGRRLKEEGIFDRARKRPLPAFPNRVAVVTSGSGAALRDVLSVLGRRYPLAEVVLCPVLVQGPDASGQIVRALRQLNRLSQRSPHRPDLIILTRGGGSMEDLWAFNEEPTVRAVHASGIPIVAGVGHETDTTLADLAADVRAATPSMAAELAVPDQTELRAALTKTWQRQAALVAGRLARGRRLVERSFQVRAYGHPAVRLERAHQLLAGLSGRLSTAVERSLERRRLQLETRMAQLRAVDPLGPLDAGFALLESDGGRITRPADVPQKEPFSIRFREGTVRAQRLRNGAPPDPLQPDC